MHKSKVLPLILFLVVFIFINVLVIDFKLLKSNKTESSSVLSSSTSSSCPSACIDLINSSTGTEQIVPISASGTTTLTDWTILPGSEITFNKDIYKGAKKIYFQANLSSDAADRIAYARLYDATHGIGIQGSDISSTSTSLVLVQSGALNPFSGNLSVKVQIKGLNGNLVTISNPRIRVIY